MRFLKPKFFLPAVLAILVFIGAGASYYFYTQYQNAQAMLKNPNLVAQNQAKEVVDAVGKLIELPNEQPTIATVADVTKLKGQPFFEHAKNGFKVLIYTGAKKAILYDPFLNKIVEVAPVNLGNNETAQQPTPQVQQQTQAQTQQVGTPVAPTAAPTAH